MNKSYSYIDPITMEWVFKEKLSDPREDGYVAPTQSDIPETANGEDFIDGFGGLELIYGIEKPKPKQVVYEDIIIEMNGKRYKIVAELID